jgi:nitrate reductase gamma subunit
MRAIKTALMKLLSRINLLLRYANNKKIKVDSSLSILFAFSLRKIIMLTGNVSKVTSRMLHHPPFSREERDTFISDRIPSNDLWSSLAVSSV